MTDEHSTRIIQDPLSAIGTAVIVYCLMMVAAPHYAFAGAAVGLLVTGLLFWPTETLATIREAIPTAPRIEYAASEVVWWTAVSAVAIGVTITVTLGLAYLRHKEILDEFPTFDH